MSKPVTSKRKITLPNLDPIRFADPAATRAWEQLRIIIDFLLGRGGNKADQVLTWADIEHLQLGNAGNVIGSVSGGVATPDGIPSAPKDLEAIPNSSVVYLRWEAPEEEYAHHAQVWRAAEDNLGMAYIVGSTPDWTFIDPINVGEVYYYWVRFVSPSGNLGDFNSFSGTQGRIAADFLSSTNALISDDAQALLYQTHMPQLNNGVNKPIGTYVRETFIANGSITNQKLGDFSVDDRKVSGLSAKKIKHGLLSPERIGDNSLPVRKIKHEFWQSLGKTSNGKPFLKFDLKSGVIVIRNIQDGSIMFSNTAYPDADFVDDSDADIETLDTEIVKASEDIRITIERGAQP